MYTTPIRWLASSDSPPRVHRARYIWTSTFIAKVNLVPTARVRVRFPFVPGAVARARPPLTIPDYSSRGRGAGVRRIGREAPPVRGHSRRPDLSAARTRDFASCFHHRLRLPLIPLPWSLHLVATASTITFTTTAIAPSGPRNTAQPTLLPGAFLLAASARASGQTAAPPWPLRSRRMGIDSELHAAYGREKEECQEAKAAPNDISGT
ncbi:hypothetical protein MSAN_00091700 [Mycena sanguinolenta]|uniref:Uncharacterized protein n=1 Tax=Mycena sanguinolenta TaxID=230812 RepID=A0A8H6ZG43_9AGAR|nr:hypothetical protein MSAN_00091700 [Mycena sanguinolenta]